MKSSYLLQWAIITRTFFVIALLGSTHLIIAQDLPENNPDAAYGLVYFLRGKGHAGSATAFSAIIDGKRVCKLNNKSYSAHRVEPGTREFKAQFGGKEGKEKAEAAVIEVEAGETYYIQMIMQQSIMMNDVTAQEITRNSALRLVKDDKIEPEHNCREE